MKKALLIVVGCIGVVLGAVGAALPFLPAFPFLLLAAVCFGKSSEKLDSWFKGTKLYNLNVSISKNSTVCYHRFCNFIYGTRTCCRI